MLDKYEKRGHIFSMTKGSKTKISFFCKECGYESAKWLGQCPSCSAVASFTEAPSSTTKGGKSAGIRGLSLGSIKPSKISEITVTEDDRVVTGIEELDRVLGGGIIPGSLTLVGGDPGIGKSTLLLQMCKYLSDNDKEVLYISGEESLKQIKMRAMRIGQFHDSVSLLCETNLANISAAIEDSKPLVVIIDSIQTMFSEEATGAPGSASQIRESTSILLDIAKRLGIAIFIVGHVTKDGIVAGPRMLEHMVDTVLYFEGDRYASYRILRGVKNRFGSTNEIGVFEMVQEGLREVTNPSEYMLSGRAMGASGTVCTASIEGTRPILLEIQALVSETTFPNPRRQSAGADYNRVNLLIAVLEKRLGLRIGGCDAYVNIAGGLKVYEPAIDLGIILALASSYLDKPIDEKLLAIGEVGLGGEVRAVNLIENRVSEAVKLGFTTIVIPKVCLERIKDKFADKAGKLEIIGVDNVKQAVDLIR